MNEIGKIYCYARNLNSGRLQTFCARGLNSKPFLCHLCILKPSFFSLYRAVGAFVIVETREIRPCRCNCCASPRDARRSVTLDRSTNLHIKLELPKLRTTWLDERSLFANSTRTNRCYLTNCWHTDGTRNSIMYVRVVIKRWLADCVRPSPLHRPRLEK